LYEFARLVRFARKIPATDNATGDLPLFLGISRCTLLLVRDGECSR
jgi:hypothetical protein